MMPHVGNVLDFAERFFVVANSDLSSLCAVQALTTTLARTEWQFERLSLVRARLAQHFTLDDDPYRSGGPARYVKVRETGGRLGFITPMTHNFCESCNRVRVTCTGTLYMCLGQEDAADLRTPLRASSDDALLHAAIDAGIARKPKGHDFVIGREHRPSVARPMSVTGG